MKLIEYLNISSRYIYEITIFNFHICRYICSYMYIMVFTDIILSMKHSFMPQKPYLLDISNFSLCMPEAALRC